MKEIDKSVLIKVIQNDSDRDVRQAARKRLQRLNDRDSFLTQMVNITIQSVWP